MDATAPLHQHLYGGYHRTAPISSRSRCTPSQGELDNFRYQLLASQRQDQKSWRLWYGLWCAVGSHAEASETQGQPPLLCWGDQNKCPLSAFFLFVNIQTRIFSVCKKESSSVYQVLHYTPGCGVQTGRHGKANSSEKAGVHHWFDNPPSKSHLFSPQSLVLNISRDPLEFTSFELVSHYEGISFVYCELWLKKKKTTKYVGCQCWV